MTEHPDVLIIGGGVIGLTAAYFLAREGAKVEVVDKGDLGQEASWAGAGILPPGNPAKAASPMAQLRAHSAALFPTLSADLRERTGVNNEYLRCGGLAFGDSGARAFSGGEPEHRRESEVDEWRAEGIVLEKMEAREIGRLEPAVASELGPAYYIPEMAQLRNPRHLKSLLAGCRCLGVHLRPGCPVYAIRRHGSEVSGLDSFDGSLPAQNYLVAMGAWTDSFLSQTGWQPGIRPIRGQIALVDTGAPIFSRVLLSGARYLVPRSDGRVLVGSTEENAGFVKQTTAAAISELLAFAYRFVPPLAEASLERVWAGLRPGSPDGLPFIGPVPGFDNLLVAAGHFRNGIGLSPATAMVITELILGRPLTVPIHDFRLDRSLAQPTQSAFRS
jgi:glycine oxidase